MLDDADVQKSRKARLVAFRSITLTGGGREGWLLLERPICGKSVTGGGKE